MKIDDNPFERWGLNPADDEEKLTRQLRNKSRFLDADERNELQQAWREMTSDAVARARWVALTPPQPAGDTDLWELAREAVPEKRTADTPKLTATLEDALVLPAIGDEQLYARPPFLPEIMRRERRSTPARTTSDDTGDNQ